MAITHRNSQTYASDSSTGSLIFTKPTGTLEGDILVAFIVYSSAGDTINPPTGFVEIEGGTGTTSVTAKSYYKVAGDSEPTTYSFTSATTHGRAGVLSSFYDSTGGGSWNIEDSSETRESSANSITSASVTAVDDSMLVIGWTNDDNEDITTAPTDMILAGFIKFSHIWSCSATSYYESRSSGAVTKSITWGGSAEELTAQAVVLTYAAATGTNTQINIGDDWKEIAAAQINIGDTWKTVF